MKVVVNKVIFDTDDAKICGTCVPYKTTLYRRLDDGTFFLLSESKQISRSFYGGPDTVKIKETTEITLHPMTHKDAQTWAEHNLPAETVYSLFSD